MLTDLPSLEVALLALWKLTIVAAALVFVVIVTMKAAKTVRRILFKPYRKRRASRQSQFDGESLSNI